jgi:uncharacterized protein YcbK (DUF882 family)
VYSVTGTTFLARHHIVRLVFAALMSITVILPQAVIPAAAASERSLYLYYTHTRETARIVFKRNGQFVQSGLAQLNQFLRDWRRNEPANMDPKLFDLIWEVYQEVGATQPINVVSAYRSPATNAMLAANSSGVADNSQHMRGTAMDFFIPGVPLARLRAVAMSKQVGGVGYYPTSGSPFVHLDTGSVRAWPRMTRAQLQDIFPDGVTMHLPSDGRPLSQQGYQVALAEWQRCHRYPCSGGSSGTAVADNGGGGNRTLMDLFFGGDGEQPAAATATAATPAPVQVAAVEPAAPRLAPVPAMRPASLGGGIAEQPVTATPDLPFSTAASAPLGAEELTTAAIVPFPVIKSASLQQATSTALPASDAVTALAALTAPVPQPRLIMTNPPATQMAAYAPPTPQDLNAQRSLQEIIEREAAVVPELPPTPAARLPILPTLTSATGIHTAAIGGTDPVGGALTGLFSGTFGAARQDEPVAAALVEHIARQPQAQMRTPDLVPPDLEHVADVFTNPQALDTGAFAVIWDHDQADFDPATEMGDYVTVMGVGDFAESLPAGRFVPAAPVAVASAGT